MSDTTLNSLRTLHLFFYSTLTVVSDITICVRSGYPLLPSPHARVFTPSLSIFSPFSGGFYPVSPRQLLESDTGVPHFALDPLTHRCLLSLSPAADFAETRTPRHRVFHFFTFKNSWVVSAVCFGSLSTCTVGSLSTCTEEAVKQQKRTAVCKCFVLFSH